MDGKQNKWINPDGSAYANPKDEYIYTPEPGLSLKALAEKWQAKTINLANQSRRERWTEQRHKYLQKVDQELSNRMVAQQVSLKEKFYKTYQGLWAAVTKGIQQDMFYKDVNGELKVKDHEPGEWNQLCQALTKAEEHAARIAGIDLMGKSKSEENEETEKNTLILEHIYGKTKNPA